jgi:hypothetical protein
MLIGAPEERKQQPSPDRPPWLDVAELLLAPVLMGFAIAWASWSTAAVAILILISVFMRKAFALQREINGVYTSLAMLADVARMLDERICELERDRL